MKISTLLAGLCVISLGHALPPHIRDDDDDYQDALAVWRQQQQQQLQQQRQQQQQQQQQQPIKKVTTTSVAAAQKAKGQPAPNAAPQDGANGRLQEASDVSNSYNAPLFPDDAPIGTFVCNGNGLYQRNYLTTTEVGWRAHAVCGPGTSCIVDMTGGKVNYVGCR
ncbi:hypothetical protein BDR26DRAFT_868130 [Obelidium mucronatum]|nr:hypothetical protein BDR26DRAFT_868130 [Obelidium mucronatum]